MNRREFLECATVLVSGVAATRSVFALTDEQITYLATAQDYSKQTVDLFSPAQRKIIAAMAGAILPRTDTPGAIDAGVPQFIELMVADWFNDGERTIFSAGIEDIETRVPQQFEKAFDQLETQQQLSILEALEAEALDTPWYQKGNIRRAFISDAPFICMIKELTIWGFFTSEAGASEVLKTNMMPMHFDSDVPLSSDDSAWASYMFIH